MGFDGMAMSRDFTIGQDIITFLFHLADIWLAASLEIDIALSCLKAFHRLSSFIRTPKESYHMYALESSFLTGCVLVRSHSKSPSYSLFALFHSWRHSQIVILETTIWFGSTVDNLKHTYRVFENSFYAE